MHAIIVIGILHWGFSVKYPLESAAQRAVAYPMPSTLVGALAATFAEVETKWDGSVAYSKAVELLDSIVFATARYLVNNPLPISPDVIAVVDVNRNIVAPYLRRQHRRDRRMWFSAQGMGKVFAPLPLEIVYLTADPNLGKYAWGIYRIGSKEGLFSVYDVEVVKAEEFSGEVFDTDFVVPAQTVEPVRGDYLSLTGWPLNRDAFTLFNRSVATTTYYVPRYLGEKVRYRRVGGRSFSVQGRIVVVP